MRTSLHCIVVSLVAQDSAEDRKRKRCEEEHALGADHAVLEVLRLFAVANMLMSTLHAGHDITDVSGLWSRRIGHPIARAAYQLLLADLDALTFQGHLTRFRVLTVVLLGTYCCDNPHWG